MPIGVTPQRRSNAPSSRRGDIAFGRPRDFWDNRFVYTVISPRARGLSVGVNLNPDKYCNFDCVYCEVNRHEPPRDTHLDVEVMLGELERTLEWVRSGQIRKRTAYRNVPDDWLKVRQVALSGDGEPTLCPNFLEVVESLVHLRARGRVPYFKLVLVTNTSGLNRRSVAEGLRLFTADDEIWAKLDAGTQDYMNRVNQPDCMVEKVLANILRLAQRRPVVIQSLFPLLGGREPPELEIEAYVQRLRELKAGGARIAVVQIYSTTRPTPRRECGHLPLRALSAIARRVREVTGLEVDVF